MQLHHPQLFDQFILLMLKLVKIIQIHGFFFLLLSSHHCFTFNEFDLDEGYEIFICYLYVSKYNLIIIVFSIIVKLNIEFT